MLCKKKQKKTLPAPLYLRPSKEKKSKNKKSRTPAQFFEGTAYQNQRPFLWPKEDLMLHLNQNVFIITLSDSDVCKFVSIL